MTAATEILERMARVVMRDHGATAAKYATAQVVQYRKKGLTASADAWQRILSTIRRIQADQS